MKILILLVFSIILYGSEITIPSIEIPGDSQIRVTVHDMSKNINIMVTIIGDTAKVHDFSAKIKVGESVPNKKVPALSAKKVRDQVYAIVSTFSPFEATNKPHLGRMLGIYIGKEAAITLNYPINEDTDTEILELFQSVYEQY